MFKNAKIGDRVWSITKGWGTIVSNNSDHTPLKPIKVEFKYHLLNYRYDGRVTSGDENPELFWNEFKIPKEAYEKLLSNLPVDTKVLVWNNKDEIKFKRYFAGYDGKYKIKVWAKGATSWSARSQDDTESWNSWEILINQTGGINMFKNAKIGDRVWSITKGWGKIVDVLKLNTDFPIRVKFNDNCVLTFTKEGKTFKEHKYPTLYWNEFEIPKEAFQIPLLDLPINTKVIVWNNNNGYSCKRHFAGWAGNNKIKTWSNGSTSWTTNIIEIWSNWEIVEED